MSDLEAWYIFFALYLAFAVAAFWIATGNHAKRQGYRSYLLIVSAISAVGCLLAALKLGWLGDLPSLLSIFYFVAGLSTVVILTICCAGLYEAVSKRR